ncbi:MAG: AraC family transcriptional regulator [Anaerocolumna sp.]
MDKEFPIINKWVMSGIINIDGNSYEQKQFGYKDIDLLHFSVKNIFMEFKTHCHKTIVNNLANVNQLFVVLSSDREEDLRKEAERLFTQLLHTLWKDMGISLTVGVSSAKNRLSAESAKEAQEAFLQRILHGNSNLYFYNDIKVLSANPFPTSELNMLRQYIERHDAGNIEFLINDIFSEEQIKNFNISYLRILWVRIIGILLKKENTTFARDSKNMEKLVLNFDVLDSFNSLKEFRDYLYSIILEGIQSSGDIDINSKNKIKLAVKYINDNYNQYIAINDMAEKFNMSPNYFSSVFKRETGQTTVNFIKDLRLKKACDYLTHSNKSVVEISKEVGYEDSQYFFKVFKKATGQTPLQYRRMRM